jgi:site-specific DNA-methyltransferase (adenine-specific)
MGVGLKRQVEIEKHGKRKRTKQIKRQVILCSKKGWIFYKDITNDDWVLIYDQQTKSKESMNWKDLFSKENKYFETENGILYCGDCLEIMKEFPKESVDLVLTDPPYGVRKKEKWDNLENFLNKVDEWINYSYGITRTVVLWFCAEKLFPTILSNNKDKFHRLLIWNKSAGSQFAGAMNTNIWYSTELILVFGKNIPKTNKQKKYGYACFSYRTIPKKKYNHPTTKPLGLMEDLVYFYSNEGEIVLDPFSGSGTTAVACEKLNRRWIGIEINEEYCEIAKKRIEETIRQRELF